MDTYKKLALTITLASAVGFGFSGSDQNSAGQNGTTLQSVDNAMTDTENGSKKAWDSTKTDSKNGWKDTENGSNDAMQDTEDGTKKAWNDTKKVVTPDNNN